MLDTQESAPTHEPLAPMTDADPESAAPARPRRAAGRPESRPTGQDSPADAITAALTAIAHAVPAHLLAPWLPIPLGTLSRHGERR